MTKERSVLKTIAINFWNSLKPRNIWGNHMGTDYNGTHYYEIPLDKSSRRSRPPRWFVPKERHNFEEDIPPEWEAWLRYRRTDPPTEEEIQANLDKMRAVRQKAADLEKEKPQGLQTSETFNKQLTSRKFPIYDDLEGTPGGKIQGKRNQPL